MYIMLNYVYFYVCPCVAAFTNPYCDPHCLIGNVS
ncbi:hypothetical protein PCPL58_2597 [Pseudomonas cerasi]|uniref:Uncharacterized protein n=1 Tax=Pseudomonas cerasi TaxID=1583341 RepID=A0A193SQD9_9PSED|nr:hypothetical protein PCPL58_2597 [Pseudomonas cerasi]SOS20931.1 hypothetical protein PL963_02833 [Pseudomonas cerasi]